ncbi:MAG: acetylxylan esterase [Prevotella sp.]|jgi:cephalosporin-C deacetylase-like acetyl esterase|nr:acetylxylan esterase [Prevotella sp.]
MKKISFIILLLALLNVMPANAQIRGNSISVDVVPDHQDWRYEVGQTAIFKICITREHTLLNNVTIDYEAGPEMYSEVKKQGVVLKDGTLTVKGRMTKPGFYRVEVKATIDGKEYKGACAAAFSPELLQPTTVMPQDFSDYWQRVVSEARQIPLNPTKRLLSERCTSDVNVYEVSFQNMQWNYRTYGILCVPVEKDNVEAATAGRYPALLRVPGAGVRPYGGDIYTASQGAITLEIGIHGISVTMEQKVYDDVFNGALMNYWNWGMDNRDDSYYKRVIIGCIRALDYIEQYTPWNGQQLAVSGSSQGGFLSLATAGLDKRITAYAPVHAALCDHTASLKGVACGWPHYFYWNKGKGQERQIETSRYYDGVNFARLITEQQKGWFSFGYNDDVVPPTTAWATYNIVKGPKEISPYQATWHYWHQEQWDEWENWLLRELGCKK